VVRRRTAGIPLRICAAYRAATSYLTGEKLDTFLMALERDPLFAADVPALIAENPALLYTR